MSGFTREDLIHEFRKLSEDLAETLQDSLQVHLEEILRRELLYNRRLNSPNGGAGVNPPPNHPEKLRDEDNHVLPSRLPPSRERQSPRPSGRFAEIAYQDSVSLDDDDDAMPFFHKGYVAKKAYDEYAPELGLPCKTPSSTSTNLALREGTSKNFEERRSGGRNNGKPYDKVGSPHREDARSVEREDDNVELVASLDMRPSATHYVSSDLVNHRPSAKAAWGYEAPIDVLRAASARQDGHTHAGDLRMYGMQKKMRPTKHYSDGNFRASNSKLAFTRLNVWLELLSFKSRRIMEGNVFDSVSALGIFLYSILVGFRTEWNARHLEDEPPLTFELLEMFFCILFSLEVAIRLLGVRGHFFKSDGWQWCLFDLLLVILQVFDLIADLAVRISRAGASNDVRNWSFIRVLRVLRLVRIVRIVRVVRLLSELRCMVSSIMSSLKSLFFTMILLSLLVFVMGIFTTQLVNETLRADLSNHKARRDLKSWATLDVSCLLLFQSLTGGVDWGEALQPLMDHISPVVSLPYCLYISFGVLCMLNVVTGVFVESACANTAEEKDANMVSRLQSFLCRTDSTNITWDEFESRLDDPEIRMYFRTVDLDISEARGLFKLLDADNSGSVQAEEFVMGCLRLRGNAKAVDLATLMYENRRWHRRIDRISHRVHSDLHEFSLKLSSLYLRIASDPLQNSFDHHNEPEITDVTAWTQIESV